MLPWNFPHPQSEVEVSGLTKPSAFNRFKLDCDLTVARFNGTMVAHHFFRMMSGGRGISSRVVLSSLFLVLLCFPLMSVSAEQKSGEKALREYYDLQEGKRLYGEYCRFCHGDQGRGQAFDVTPPPADLTSPAVQQKSDSQLTQTIHEGERGTAMGSWKWALSKEEKQHILLYIRWLAQQREQSRSSTQ